MDNQQAFTAYLEEQVQARSIYVWGAQGETGSEISEAWIRRRETSAKNARRAIDFWQKQVRMGYGASLRAFDCSGLGVFWLLENGLISSDMSSNTMYRRCRKLSRAQLRTGDWVFRKNAVRVFHVGYVVDDALNVIEAKGRDHGVIKLPLDAAGEGYWNAFGRPEFVFKSAEEAAENSPTAQRVLKLASPMMRGGDVLALQSALLARGYSPGALDGVFGANTDAAVRSFQAAGGLYVDGEAGRDTAAALEMTLT